MMSENQNNRAEILLAKEEYKQWREQLGQLQTDKERQEFAVRLHQMLAKKDEKTLTAGLVALREYAHDIRLEAERLAKPDAVVQLQVFPKSESEKALLLDFLERKGIPFKVAA